MYLRTSAGIKEVPKKRLIKALFCRHPDRMRGVDCSPQGLVRISGRDEYEVCQDCGKILRESHVNY